MTLMDSRILAMLAVLLAACGGDERQTQSREPAPIPSEPNAAEPVAEDRGPVPRCGAPENASELTDFSGVVPGDGAERYVAVHYAGSRNGWLPSERIDMPIHHATRLSWTNLDDFEALGVAQYEELRFTFEVLARDLYQRGFDPPAVRAELSARVTQVCSLSASAGRAEGALLAAIRTGGAACDGLTRAAVEAAEALAVCSQDADCTVIEVPTCDLEGVGCYWHAASRSRSPAPLLTAIRAIETGGCPSARCDCPTPPTTARCADGRAEFASVRASRLGSRREVADDLRARIAERDLLRHEGPFWVSSCRWSLTP